MEAQHRVRLKAGDDGGTLMEGPAARDGRAHTPTSGAATGRRVLDRSRETVGPGASAFSGL